MTQRETSLWVRKNKEKKEAEKGEKRLLFLIFFLAEGVLDTECGLDESFSPLVHPKGPLCFLFD